MGPSGFPRFPLHVRFRHPTVSAQGAVLLSYAIEEMQAGKPTPWFFSPVQIFALL
jgi:hypothetical protein